MMKYTILIIEDDQGLSELIKDSVGIEEREVVCQFAGKDALEYIKYHRIDLMILDYTLPDMTGAELIHVLTQKGLIVPPFIVSTGRGDEQTAVEMMKLGALDYVIKNMQFLEILPLVVDRVLAEIENKTRLKIAESKLAQTNMLNKQIVESTIGGVVVCDLELQCLIWNQYMERLSGLNGAEVVGTRILEKFDFLRNNGTGEIIDIALRKGVRSEIEFEFNIEETGKGGWVSLSVGPLLDATQTTIGVLGFIHDISKRKENELLMEQSRKEFFDLFENAPIGYHEIDMEGRILKVNRTEANLLGYTVEEMVGKLVWDFLKDTPQSKKRTLSKLNKGVFGNEPYERIYITKTGAEFLALLVDKAIYALDGNIAGLRTSLQNITERKKAELETEHLKRHYQAIIENSADGYVLINSEGKFVYISPNARRMFGYLIESAEELLPHDLTHPEDVEGVLAKLKIVNDNPEISVVLEYRFKHRNGSWVWIESTFTNLLNDAAVEAIVINFRNIQERKQAEERLVLDEKRLESLLTINELKFDSIQSLLDTTLAEITKLTDSEIGFISSYSSDTKKHEMISWSRQHMAGRFENVDRFQLADNEIWAEAVRTGRPVVVNDFSQYALHFAQMPPTHAELIRFLIIPVSYEGEIVALAAVANKRDMYDDSDIRQLTLMMGSVWKIVAKKTSDIKLHESEERFRTIFQSSNVGKSITTLDGALQVNQAFSDLVGYSIEELNQLFWRDITHPDDIAFNEEALIRITTSSDNSLQWEKRFIHKSGKVVWVSINTILVKNQDEKPLYFVTEVYDITQSKMASEAIKESEERYRMLAENTSDVIWKTNQRGEITYISPSVFQMCGYTVSEVLGKHKEKLIPFGRLLEMYDAFVSSRTQYRSGTRSECLELEQICKNGTVIFTESTVQLVEDERGNPVGLVGVTREVTARKKMELALQQNRDMLKRLFVESSRFIESEVNEVNYQAINDEIGTLSGARFSIFNLFEDNGKEFKTVAISGWNTLLKPIKNILGYDPLNKKWAYDPGRDELIDGKTFTRFEALSELTRSVISPTIVNVITRMFGIGEVWIVQVRKNNKPYGDFTLLFEKSMTLKNKEVLELFVNQIGLFIERVLSVNALRKSEEMYRNLVMRIPDGVYKSTHYGKFLEVNPALVQMLGYDSRDELLHINILSDLYFKVSDRDDNSVLKQQDDTRSVFPLRRKDGTPVWVEDHGWYNMDENGKVISHEGVLRDVSQRMKDEEFLRNNEQKFRMLFMENPQPMFIYDMESYHILDVNKASELHYGFSREEFLKMSVGDLRTEDEYPQFLDFIYQIKRSDTKKRIQTKHVCKNGNVIDVEVYSATIKLDGKKARQVLINDITEQLRAERALKKSESDLLESLRLANMGFWEYDLQADLFTFNDQFYAIYNTTAEQAGGYTMNSHRYSESYLHPDERGIVNEVLAEVVSADARASFKSFDHRIICPDGTLKYIMVSVKVERTENGTLVKLVGANQDITSRKLTEMMLEKSELFFRNSQMAAHIGSYVLDFESGVWESSEVLDEIFGIDDKYNRSMNTWLDLVHEDDRKMMGEYFQNEVIAVKMPFNKEYRIRRIADGVVRWMHGLGELTLEGEVVHTMTGTIQDITERKEAELQLQQRVDELVRFQNVTVGRELAMIELKKEVNHLLETNGESIKYKIIE